MAFNLIQAGASLYSVNPAGGISAALTLPTGVTLSDKRVPRFTRFKRYVVVVNTPSRPVTVDDTGTVRPLTPLPPTSTPVLAGETGGTLSGAFLAKQTFVFLDAVGNLIAESDYGPLPIITLAAPAITISAQYLRMTNLSLSPDTSAISGTRIYRTTKGPGAAYFQWLTIPGNTQTRVRDDKSDAALQVIAAPTLGSAPDLTLIAEWQGRLWGVDRLNRDDLRYTEAGTAYAWSALNTLPIAHVGDDRFGITGFAPRRETLGVGRQNRLVQIAGNTRANIRPVGVIENCGFLSQESVVVYRDIVFFLWRDGIYQWDADGLICVSDRAGVGSWFKTNDFFNRGMFSQAFATFDPISLSYRLFLCSANSTVPDRWVEYSLKTSKCYGPHLTNAFTPTCAMWIRGTNDQLYPMVGSREGYVSQDIDERTDWGLFSIPMHVTIAGHDGGDSDNEKYFGQLSVQTEKEPKGTLTITPSVGDPDAEVAGDVMSYDLTQTRERLDRIGTGKAAGLIFANDERGQHVTIRGYQIDPVHVIGRR